MSWVRVDDQMPRHPKLLSLGRDRLACQGVWMDGACYASTYLTDGFVPTGVLDRGSERYAELLVNTGLWESVEGGYRIHDYLDYQPSREDALWVRAIRSKAGRRGGQQSGESRRGKTEANGEAKSFAPASTTAKQNGTPSRIRPVPVPSPVPVDRDTYVDPLALYAERVGRRPGPKERDWLEDLHSRFSRTALVNAMNALPKGPDFLKRLDARLEGLSA